MSRAFLRANWQNLAMVSYAVPEELLVPRLPPGCELDCREGRAFVSLVAFEFLNTRVLGVKWPGRVNFLEWNLRFYVRQGERRGVVFVREFVRNSVIAWAARASYNEPYSTASLSQRITKESMVYGVEWQGHEAEIELGLRPEPYLPQADSAEVWFTDQHWGFGRLRSGKRAAYAVEHPAWEVLPVTSVHVQLDWAAMYGAEWGVMQGAEPYNALFALGSEATVARKST